MRDLTFLFGALFVRDECPDNMLPIVLCVFAGEQLVLNRLLTHVVAQEYPAPPWTVGALEDVLFHRFDVFQDDRRVRQLRRIGDVIRQEPVRPMSNVFLTAQRLITAEAGHLSTIRRYNGALFPLNRTLHRSEIV